MRVLKYLFKRTKTKYNLCAQCEMERLSSMYPRDWYRVKEKKQKSCGMCSHIMTYPSYVHTHTQEKKTNLIQSLSLSFIVRLTSFYFKIHTICVCVCVFASVGFYPCCLSYLIPFCWHLIMSRKKWKNHLTVRTMAKIMKTCNSSVKWIFGSDKEMLHKGRWESWGQKVNEWIEQKLWY